MDGQLNANQQGIITTLMGSQPILKYLLHDKNDIDVTKQDDLSDTQKEVIRANNIYEYRKIPDDKFVEQKTYISMEYGAIAYMTGLRKDNPYHMIPSFYFYIVTHASLDSNEINGSRINAIEWNLIELFHKKCVIPKLGYSYIYTSNKMELPNGYVGRVVEMRFTDNTRLLFE